MRIHYCQHVPFETPGSISAWAKENHHEITGTRLYAAEQLPPLNDVDWLVIMGGPLNIYEDRDHPWLVEERRYIDQAVKENRVVVGICLGAQLIADVLGSKVFRNRHREIGWSPITMTEHAMASPLCGDFPQTFEVFHWHGDTFDLPAGSELLARSEACETQMFLYKDRVLGLQCHLEMTPRIASRLTVECAADLASGPYAQSAHEILADEDRFRRVNEKMSHLLTCLERTTGGES